MIILSRQQKYGYLSGFICLLFVYALYTRSREVPGEEIELQVARPSSAFSDERAQGQWLQVPSTNFLQVSDVAKSPRPYSPYPPEKKPWSVFKGASRRACKGPEGRGRFAAMQAYQVSSEHPNPIPLFGSYKELGLDDGHCFDRVGRLAPYGYTEDGTEENSTAWNNVDWGSLQEHCIEENRDRYRLGASTPFLSRLKLPEVDSVNGNSSEEGVTVKVMRTAVVLRGWDSIEYTTELLQHIRANIDELSLHTAGEYAVYLMVEVKDSAREIHNSSAAYAQAMEDFVPQELRSMTLLFNEALLEAWYPGTNPANGGQMLHMNQPLQLFSLFNPQFDFVWGVELDVRFTGNWYNLFSSMAAWSKKSPRKLQWERASTFYIPSYHGSYRNFSESLLARFPDGGVWGPVLDTVAPIPLGPEPPSVSATADNFEWGVGEEADDITPSAVIDTLRFGIFEKFTVAGFEELSQRRALMVTPLKRLSRRLLMAMHQAEVDGFDMRSELFAHTIALAHGMKIAHAPVPMYFDDETISPAEVDQVFNNGQEKARIWTDGGNESNLQAMSKTTFWWRLEFEQFPRRLYRRWYGLDGDGGALRNERSRLCLPGILLHPVKDVVRKSE